MPRLCGDITIAKPLCGGSRVEANHATDPEVRHPSAFCQSVDMVSGATDPLGQLTGGPRFRSALNQSDGDRVACWCGLPLIAGEGNAVEDFRLVFAILSAMGEMKRAIAWEQGERQQQDRFNSTVAICASIIAAVRLARDDVATPTPRVFAAAADSAGRWK